LGTFYIFSFDIFGLELKTTVVNGQCYKDIPEFWLACAKNGKYQALAEAASKKNGELIDAGVTYAHNPNGSMNYMIGCIKNDDIVFSEYTTLSIPKQTWVTDISYIDTGEGWLYPATVKDLFNSEIVGWSTADNMKTELCINALNDAVKRQLPLKG